MQAVYTTNVHGPVTKETRGHFYRRKCKQSIPQMFMDLSPKKQGATFTGENASSLYHKCSWTCHQRNKGPLLQEKMQAVYTTNVHGPVAKETRGHFYRRKCILSHKPSHMYIVHVHTQTTLECNVHNSQKFPQVNTQVYTSTASNSLNTSVHMHMCL